jgi:hypothetical protein
MHIVYAIAKEYLNRKGREPHAKNIVQSRPQDVAKYAISVLCGFSHTADDTANEYMAALRDSDDVIPMIVDTLQLVG